MSGTVVTSFHRLSVLRVKERFPRMMCEKVTKNTGSEIDERNPVITLFVIGRSLDSSSDREGFGKESQRSHYLDPDK